ncbi:hypothetical protein B0O80DRAFT_499630 [Mortierella sp. GBAus27b]|nr:hypothetical protein B0O80DRAFT_499630 [Mortierella sp. GBAus27b]
MLGLPEIDDVICSHLERYDLARCARVNKQWHDSVIPHLWRNLSWFAWSSTSVSRLAFRRTILEDYLCEHGYRIEPSNDQVPTSLVKYSRWIWTLPSLHTLFTIFKPQATERQRPLDRKVQEPSVNELLFHLYKNCRSVRNITIPNYGPECDKLIEVIMEHVIPRVESLSIYTGPNDVRKLEQLLDRCSTALGSLTLSGVKIKTDEEINCAMEEQQCSKAWPMVKSLSLLSCSDNSQHKMFWTWLCRRYSSVEALLASDLGEVAQFLIPAISAHMPKLSDIYFSESSSSVQGMTDSVFASLLSCSRDGWKSVYITSRNLEFGEASKRALLEHCRTLEMLGVHECRAFFEFDLSKVLSSSPNLHTLDTISNDYGCSSSQDEVEQGLHFEMFVDKDLAGSLSVWECETTLTVLKIRISSIPRQDIGQGREMQGQVYDRLARLVNLEELWLGNGTLLPSACLPYEERYFQVNCLELSLDSGLEKLAGLKSLRELNVWGMDHNIRLKEAQWMTKHWPQLEALYGLDDRRTGLCYLTGEPWDDFYDEELVGWMAKNFPWINLTSYA